MIKPKFVIILFFLFIYTSGCGYTTKSLLPRHIDTIHVQTFKNKIDITQLPTSKQEYKLYTPLLETDITNFIINRFIYDGRLNISKIKKADSILSGDLLDYRKEPLRYDIETDQIREYRVSLVARIQFRDTATNNLLIDKNIIGDTTYFTTGALAISESEALDKAIDDLARRIVEEVIEVW